MVKGNKHFRTEMYTTNSETDGRIKSFNSFDILLDIKRFLYLVRIHQTFFSIKIDPL